MKTIGEERIETEERIGRLSANPDSATSEDVKWLILQIRIEQRKIANDGYYC